MSGLRAGSSLTYTMLKGSSVSASGAPVVSLSKKVNYFSAQRSGSALTFDISGQDSADIVINGVAASSVTRDGVTLYFLGHAEQRDCA